MRKNDRRYNLITNPKINHYTSSYIIELLTHESLIKLQEFMRKQKSLKITQFMRFFRQLIPLNPKDEFQNQQFFINYGLFRFFKEICKIKKKTQVTFLQISTFIAEKMPTFTEMFKIQEKLLPINMSISEEMKSNIRAPAIVGKMIQQRQFFIQKPYKSDKIHHMNRTVGMSEYSQKFKIYITNDEPSSTISILDDDFNLIRTLQTQQQVSKRDAIIHNIAWSQKQEKVACLMGNYSISLWSKDDEFKYEVNVPLPPQYLANPYVKINYMDSLGKWITFDNRPAIYVLSNKNFEPQYVFTSKKMRKVKETEKIIVTELKYRQIVCVAFERNIFLVSLKNKEIVSEVTDYKTSITSIAFSESFQALFVSTYDKQFFSYEINQFQDMIERGKFEGHKTQISLLGVLESKPVVFSIQENSILRMYDMRDFSCYQSFSVLKNITYKQILYLEGSICLIGSKMHVYKLQKKINYKEEEKILFLGEIEKNILAVTNKSVKIYDIRNGALAQVVKGIFDSDENSKIFSAYYIDSKKRLFILNEEGDCVVFETFEMTKIRKFKFEPKPFSMYYDDINELFVQCSLGNIYISHYDEEYSKIEERRRITHKERIVSFLNVNELHDLIIVSYEGDDNVYFFAYEKGRILGFLNFGKAKIVKNKNAYIPELVIKRIVSVELFEKQNIMIILLYDEVLIVTYKRTSSSISFFMKKRIKLWDEEYLTKQLQLKLDPEDPIYSAGLSLFDQTIVVISNKVNIMVTIKIEMSKLKYEVLHLNRENYNPYRIGAQEHTQTVDLKNPLVLLKDEVTSEFPLNYHYKKSKMDKFLKCEKIGNLLAIADNENNIYFYEKDNWDEVSGQLNFSYTLPSFWNIFNYSEKQLEQIDFVLNFIQNEQKMLAQSTVLRQSLTSIVDILQNKQLNLTNITITELLKEDREKNKGLNSYRSCSLRQKKMVLQKERDEKQKMLNFIEHRNLQNKSKTGEKGQAQKQIHQTLSYLSLNHNDTILKKGIVEEEDKKVKLLERKLNASLAKDDKKSIVSNITGKQSLRSRIKVGKGNHKIEKLEKIEQIPAKKSKTSIEYEQISQKLGLSASSKKLIEKLKVERDMSQKKAKSVFKQASLPKLMKL